MLITKARLRQKTGLRPDGVRPVPLICLLGIGVKSVVVCQICDK